MVDRIEGIRSDVRRECGGAKAKRECVHPVVLFIFICSSSTVRARCGGVFARCMPVSRIAFAGVNTKGTYRGGSAIGARVFFGSKPGPISVRTRQTCRTRATRVVFRDGIRARSRPLSPKTAAEFTIVALRRQEFGGPSEECCSSPAHGFDFSQISVRLVT